MLFQEGEYQYIMNENVYTSFLFPWSLVSENSIISQEYHSLIKNEYTNFSTILEEIM